MASLSFCSEEVMDAPAPTAFECTSHVANPKGKRVVGLDILDLSQTGSFNDNIDLAKQMGIDFIALHINWTAIETSPNVFIDPDDALASLAKIAIDNNLKFSLTIRPIDLTGKTVPKDLENKRFNVPEMSNRFDKLMDFVFTKVDPSVLQNLQIGNEIDGYDTASEAPDFWQDYGIFLGAIAHHIHLKYPSLQIGFTGTIPGLLENPAVFNDLLQNVDILGATYYPLNSDFNVKHPTVVFEDLNALVAAFPSKPIYLQEVGYQSSPTNNSSESKQAEFYCNFFAAWDSQRDAIFSANLVRLHDYSITAAQEGARPYDISDIVFIEYLRTLGIRTYDGDGTEKEAFSIIQDNLIARGW
ncbi:hypothetical protein FGM00_04240 [Aggregatimonas sangjinii]|uniref:Arabinogalactan endo-beta-1,4-galactanase n=1 Tax=Aggregatimonas sangjinii TaxID=2583587 RepID=A0A5B7SQW1_9FLAO|nr:hypothetical protein [Aggregatimonas sangjinii]QCW99357.1 hypothetical protein FGM00_04240 [Aggregatimonas sangjinii]